jgi:hypothetical protein
MLLFSCDFISYTVVSVFSCQIECLDTLFHVSVQLILE